METKRQDAPDELEHVRAFVNTADLGDGRDQLTTGAALVRWLAERGLARPKTQASQSDLERAIALREALREILLAHGEEGASSRSAWRSVDKAARRARLQLRFGEDGRAALEPQAPGVDGAMGRLIAIVDRAIERGTWERLKACREESCQWAFYDHTKNRSGSWCTMKVCGNRAKARAYRERRKEHKDPEPSAAA